MAKDTSTKKPAKSGVSSTSTIKTAPRTVKRRRPKETLHSSTLFGSQNNFTIKQDANVELVFPRFNEGSMIFRPLPNLDLDALEQGELKLAGYRLSQGSCDFDSDWITKHPAASFAGIGDDAITFLLYDENGELSETERKENPYLVLYHAVRRAVKRDHSHPEWNYLIEGSKGKGAVIPSPSDLFFVQAWVYKNGKDQFFSKKHPPLGFSPDDRLHVVQFKGSDRERTGGYRLLDLSDMVNPNWEGDENDWEQSMMFGDLISPEHGRFVMLYNPELETPGEIAEEDIIGEDVDISEIRRSGGEETGRGKKARGYQVRIDEHVLIGNKFYTQTTPHIPPSLRDNVTQKARIWDDVLRFGSYEEQALWLCKAYRSVASVIRYGFQGYPEWLTKEADKILRNAKQVALTSSALDKEQTKAERKQAVKPKAAEEEEETGLIDDDETAAGGEEELLADDESPEISEDEAEETAEVEETEESEEESAEDDESEYDPDEDAETEESEEDESGEEAEYEDGTEGEEESSEEGLVDDEEEAAEEEPAPAKKPARNEAVEKAKKAALERAATRRPSTNGEAAKPTAGAAKPSTKPATKPSTKPVTKTQAKPPAKPATKKTK
jgi:hypothetical protein